MWLCWKPFFLFWPTLLLWPSCQLWHYWNYDQQNFPCHRHPVTWSDLRLLQNPIPTSIIELERPSQLLLSENVWMYTVWQNWRVIKDNISIIDHEYVLYLVPFAVTLRPRTNSLKLRKPLLSESRVWKIWKWLKLHLIETTCKHTWRANCEAGPTGFEGKKLETNLATKLSLER